MSRKINKGTANGRRHGGGDKEYSRTCKKVILKWRAKLHKLGEIMELLQNTINYLFLIVEHAV